MTHMQYPLIQQMKDSHAVLYSVARSRGLVNWQPLGLYDTWLLAVLD